MHTLYIRMSWKNWLINNLILTIYLHDSGIIVTILRFSDTYTSTLPHNITKIIRPIIKCIISIVTLKTTQ